LGPVGSGIRGVVEQRGCRGGGARGKAGWERACLLPEEVHILIAQRFDAAARLRRRDGPRREVSDLLQPDRAEFLRLLCEANGGMGRQRSIVACCCHVRFGKGYLPTRLCVVLLVFVVGRVEEFVGVDVCGLGVGCLFRGLLLPGRRGRACSWHCSFFRPCPLFFFGGGYFWVSCIGVEGAGSRLGVAVCGDDKIR
jgi:hypothetical protein